MRLFPFAIGIVAGLAISAQDRNTRIAELLSEKFAARLDWETLWNPPREVQAPLGRSIQLQVLEKEREISFCSSELQECTRYVYEAYQLAEDREHRAMNSGETSIQALAAFNSETVPVPFNSRIIGGELSPTQRFATRLVVVRLETRPAIVARYRNHKPDEKTLNSLKSYFINDRELKLSFQSLTIASFMARDPEIVVFGNRRDGVSVVFSIRWDAEIEMWANGWSIDAKEDPEEVERQRQIVEAIECARVVFDK